MIAIGETLREVRETKGISLSSLSSITGVNKSYISKIENNLREPSITVLNNICKGVGVPLNLFILLSERDEDIEYAEINNMLKELVRAEIKRHL